MRAGAKKKGATWRGSAQQPNLSENPYFPFFGPLASSFLPFFFIVKLLSSATPHGPQLISVMWLGRRYPSCHVAPYTRAARGCQENSVLPPKISRYCATPPV